MSIQESTELVAFLLTRELQPVETVVTLTVDGEPVSKARPRFDGRGYKSRAFTPAKTKQAEERLAWIFRQAAPDHSVDDQSTFGVFAVFFSGTRQRRDVDNMIKLVCDSLNGVCWKDDSQVIEVSGRRGVDHPSNARTEVWIYRVGRIAPPPHDACVRCGKQFRTYKSWQDNPNGKKYCSPECGYAAVKERRISTCAECGVTFSRDSHPRTYCSPVCKKSATVAEWDCVVCGDHVEKPKSWVRVTRLCSKAECQRTYWNARRAGAARGTCATCGGPTSKKVYTNCRGCAAAARKKESAS